MRCAIDNEKARRNRRCTKPGDGGRRRSLDKANTAVGTSVAALLYENQRERGLDGHFRLKTKLAKELQPSLPLAEKSIERKVAELALPTIALLGVIAELPSRYYPEQLAASVGASERAGLTGRILDRMLGIETGVDEEAVKLAIAELCAAGLIRVTATRRLEATAAGVDLWHRHKK